MTEAAEREKLSQVLFDAFMEGKDATNDQLADAILAAGFRLVTPGEDAVEGAREVVTKYVTAKMRPGWIDRLEEAIARFATAHAEKEREECAKIADDRSDAIKDHKRHAEILGRPYTAGFSGAGSLVAMNIAAAIRARKP